MNTDGMIIDSIKKIHSHEEILQALRVIKDVCSQHGKTCVGCPFNTLDAYGDDTCRVCSDEVSPSEWDIKDENDDWKAFN